MSLCTLHLWPVSKLLYAWRRSRPNRNIAWKFGQYNSGVLFQNSQKWSFHNLYTLHHSLWPEILAVKGFGFTKYVVWCKWALQVIAFWVQNTPQTVSHNLNSRKKLSSQRSKLWLCHLINIHKQPVTHLIACCVAVGLNTLDHTVCWSSVVAC